MTGSAYTAAAAATSANAPLTGKAETFFGIDRPTEIAPSSASNVNRMVVSSCFQSVFNLFSICFQLLSRFSERPNRRAPTSLLASKLTGGP
jgi:hypothetical protein